MQLAPASPAAEDIGGACAVLQRSLVPVCRVRMGRALTDLSRTGVITANPSSGCQVLGRMVDSGSAPSWPKWIRARHFQGWHHPLGCRTAL